MTKLSFGAGLIFILALTVLPLAAQDKKLKPLDKNASVEKSVSWLKEALKANSSHIFRYNYGGANQATVSFNFKPLEFEGCSVEYEFSKSLLETERRAVYRLYDSPNPAAGINREGAFISAEFKANRNQPVPSRQVDSVLSAPDLTPNDGRSKPAVNRPYLKKTVLGQVLIDLAKIDAAKIFVRKDPASGSFVLTLPLVAENFLSNKGLTAQTREKLGEHFFQDEQTANLIMAGFRQAIGACRRGN